MEGAEQPSVYIGESGRSLFERGKEHWKDFAEKKEESHIWYHHQLHHGGIGEPKFHLRPIAFHQTALNRQLTEAVRIGRMGNTTGARLPGSQWERRQGKTNR